MIIKSSISEVISNRRLKNDHEERTTKVKISLRIYLKMLLFE
ncbi:hypothetical protein [Kosmotoga pacifica]|nr:hypothetical protein [Kosmotoga pacifica]